MGFELFEMKAFIKGNWKLLRLPQPFGNGQWQLYDLEKDPHELVNLAGSGPLQKIEAELNGKLDKWWKPQPHN